MIKFLRKIWCWIFSCSKSETKKCTPFKAFAKQTVSCGRLEGTALEIN
jgi:hypothetical protein